MKNFMVLALLCCLATAAAAQVSESDVTNAKGERIGKSVTIGKTHLMVRTEGDRFGAGDMPALTFLKDADGRDVSIVTDKGASVADIHLNEKGHADNVTLGNGLKLTVVAQGKNGYKETLIGTRGKVLSDRIVDTTYSRANDPVLLDPIARDLGLSARWRDEVTIESADFTYVVKEKKSGKTLLYIVRDGPNKVGFDANGTPLYYDVMAQFYFGHTTDPSEYAKLQTLIPDHFIYTHDGRIGAYVAGPALTAISSFWTEKDASGATIVNFRAGEVAAPTTPHPGASSSPSSSPGSTTTSGARRLLHPRTNDGTTTYCIVDVQTTEWGDLTLADTTYTVLGASCTTTTYLTPAPAPSGGGGTSAPSNQITSSATLRNAVNNGINTAATKLKSQQCAALLSSLTTTSPQAGGTPLIQIMNQRGTTDPAYYLMNRIGFYDGQTKVDRSGTAPCQVSSRYAWTTPSSTQVWVCTLFGTNLASTPGMAADIVIHELLHTLGLPEGSPPNFYTNEDITNLVIQACGQ